MKIYYKFKVILAGVFLIIFLLLLYISSNNAEDIGAGDSYVPEIPSANLLLLLLEYQDVVFKNDYDEIPFENYWYDLFYNKANEYFAEVFTDKHLHMVPLYSDIPVIKVRLDRLHPGRTIVNAAANPLTEFKYQLDFDIYEALSVYVPDYATSDDLLIYVIVAGYEITGTVNTGIMNSVSAHAFIPEWIINDDDQLRAVMSNGHPPISWAVSGELFGFYYDDILMETNVWQTHPVPVGLVVHELLHLYGIPDITNRQGGRYCLMGSGMWNNTSDCVIRGTYPLPPSAVIRHLLNDGVYETCDAEIRYILPINYYAKFYDEDNIYLVELHDDTVVIWEISNEGYYIPYAMKDKEYVYPVYITHETFKIDADDIPYKNFIFSIRKSYTNAEWSFVYKINCKT